MAFSLHWNISSLARILSISWTKSSSAKIYGCLRPFVALLLEDERQRRKWKASQRGTLGYKFSLNPFVRCIQDIQNFLWALIPWRKQMRVSCNILQNLWAPFLGLLQGGSFPVMKARLQPDSFAKIGPCDILMYLESAFDNQWPTKFLSSMRILEETVSLLLKYHATPMLTTAQMYKSNDFSSHSPFHYNYNQQPTTNKNERQYFRRASDLDLHDQQFRNVDLQIQMSRTKFSSNMLVWFDCKGWL